LIKIGVGENYRIDIHAYQPADITSQSSKGLLRRRTSAHIQHFGAREARSRSDPVIERFGAVPKTESVFKGRIVTVVKTLNSGVHANRCLLMLLLVLDSNLVAQPATIRS